MGSIQIGREPNLWASFREQVQRTPQKTAITEGGESLTYLQLEAKAVQFGNFLRSRYAEADSKFVAILLPQGQDFLVSALAIFYTFRSCAPLSVDYPASKLQFMLEDLGNPILITHGSVIEGSGLLYPNVVLVCEHQMALSKGSDVKTSLENNLPIEKCVENGAPRNRHTEISSKNRAPIENYIENGAPNNGHIETSRKNNEPIENYVENGTPNNGHIKRSTKNKSHIETNIQNGGPNNEHIETSSKNNLPIEVFIKNGVPSNRHIERSTKSNLPIENYIQNGGPNNGHIETSCKNNLPIESYIENPIAFAYFTSGSTGFPKAVLLKHSTLEAQFRAVIPYFGITAADDSLLFLNPAFSFSTHEIWPNLLAGVTLHVPPPALRYDIPSLRQWVRARGITILCMVSSAAEVFFTAPASEFPPTLRWIYCSGEKLSRRPPPGTPFTVYCAYGSTETLAIVRAQVTHQIEHPGLTRIPAGKPFPGVQVHIVDTETQEPVAQGQVGEILVGGAYIAHGYLNRDQAETEQKFTGLPDGSRVVRMGDLGYFLPDGNLVIVDRLDSQIKVSGFRFDLGEIEAAMTELPSVEKAVAVLDPNSKVHLFYTGAQYSVLEINEFLQSRIPHFVFPNSVSRLESFPLNSHGKIDRAGLLAFRHNNKEVRIPTTETQRLLAGVWAEVLGLSYGDISLDDNFFALGGSSMLASKVIAKLRDWDPNCPAQVFNCFRIPVLSRFAEFLETRTHSQAEDLTDFEAEVERHKVNYDLSKAEAYNFNAKAEGILLTGSTGYLGSSLLLELMAETEADIYCLIRASTESEALGRLEQCFKDLGLSLEDNHRSRLVIIPGDVSRPNFGLPEPAYSALASKVQQVVHCASEVHFLKRYEELRGSNVGGTLEILKFASTQRLKFVHYISTLGMFGFRTDGKVIQESAESIGPCETGMGYNQSKWVAERLFWKAVGAGLPGTVYRPGIVGSHSNGRTINSKDFLALLFQTCSELGAYPELPWKFPYSTLDFTARAIVRIARKGKETNGRAYHVYQDVHSFEDFYGELEEQGLVRGALSEWKGKVTGSSDHPVLDMMKQFFSVVVFKGLPFFELPFLESTADFSNVNTMKEMEEEGLEKVGKAEQIKNFVSTLIQARR